MSANVTATMNGTQSMSSCFNPTATRIGETFAYCLLFVVSLAGNILIGIIVYKEKALRTPINILIVNMAISDLLFSIICFPALFVRLNAASHWLLSGPFGQALCRLRYFVTDVSIVVSVQSLVLIAVDRFVAVVFPLRPSLISSKRCRLFILVIWVVAMAVCCPQLLVWKVVDNTERLVCQRELNDKFRESSSIKNYTLVTIIVFLYVPLVLIAIFYFSIAVRIKSQKIPGEPSVNARKQRLKRERNALKMSVAIVFAFAVCWLPSCIIFFLFLFLSDSAMMSSCAFQYSAHITIILVRSYCAVNPCICFIFSGNYRQGLKNLLGCFSTNEAALT
ncbi:QRFP-like peptide receptor [Pocillopora verrucosa]|uniref:QRFP-like peptide receptor n=1 Tax=Pocillopora verrucosa TaxID=203993 RepID=UPI00333EE86D